jgi:ribulose-phosphate 3-epimerase
VLLEDQDKKTSPFIFTPAHSTKYNMSKPDVKGIIAPSLLSGDFARFGEDAKKMIDFGADWLHVDVMDGHFVPNLTIGPPVVQSLRKYLGASAFLDCHLMIESPEKWIQQFAKAGASSVTLHIETLRMCKPYNPLKFKKKYFH